VDTRATDVDDPTEHPRWGRVGKQTIANGGPLPPHPDMDAAANLAQGGGIAGGGCDSGGAHGR
jgi:arylsulfatase